MKGLEGLLLLLGRAAGVVGVVICAAAVALRLAGSYWIAGFQLGTLLLAGMSAMVFACLCFLMVLVERAQPGR